MRQAADRCDLAVTNGTHGTGVAMLLAGKPLVQVPIYLEQGLFAKASERLGASVTASPKNAAGILQGIERVLDDHGYTQAATRIADRYRNRNLDALALQIVDELERLLPSH